MEKKRRARRGGTVCCASSERSEVDDGGVARDGSLVRGLGGGGQGVVDAGEDDHAGGLLGEGQIGACERVAVTHLLGHGIRELGSMAERDGTLLASYFTVGN